MSAPGVPADESVEIDLLRRPVSYRLPPTLVDGGGEAVFLGRTRAERHAEHGDLLRLDYEAYDGLARTVLGDLAAIAFRDHGARFVRLHHALGPVPVGSASVLVQVVCPHRAEAFAACRMLIDRLKSEAPIWKREVWADGTTWSPGTPVTTR